MFFIQLLELQKSFSEQKPLLENLNFTFSEGTVLGIVGRNGEGKTTLLQLIAGVLEADSGKVIFSKQDATIGYHTQFIDTQNLEGVSIEEYILSSFENVYRLYREINTLIENYQEGDVDTLIALQTAFDEQGGYRIQGEIDHALVQLGLAGFKPETTITTLSGGQKTRLQLAKVLIQNPDVLLLDEPTNHLDVESSEWLVKYIQKRRGITIIVSHDRNFLNKTSNQILELEKGNAKLYTGNYNDFYSAKQTEIERNLEEIKQTNRKVEKLTAAAHAKASLAKKQHYQRPDKKTYGRHSRTIMRNKAGKKFRSVKMMQKRIDNQLLRNQTIAPVKQRNMGFEVNSTGRTGDFILRVHNFDLEIAGKVLVKNVDLELRRGERAAIAGENGSGKTSLIKSIIARINSDTGEIKLGPNVTCGFYAQEHEGIDLNLTVIDDFRREFKMSEKDAGNYLHKLLFTYEQLRQKVGDLSQGEKSKLVLAKLLAGEHNFLILDEPTNHLDIASREVLENALKNYDGTLLIVSHDTYFLEKVGVDKVYEIKHSEIREKNS
ncbi:MAG: ribosomal protection-like ABC-F family protein [Candidatus Dojkabacteria bacterium]